MGYLNFSCSCSNCESTVFNDALFLNGQGLREAFCSLKCLAEWAGNRTAMPLLKMPIIHPDKPRRKKPT